MMTNPLLKKSTTLFITVLILIQLNTYCICKPIGGEPPIEAVLLADQKIREFLAGEISFREMSQMSNSLNSVETERDEPIALSPDDLNAVNSAKVQSWQTVQAAKELMESQSKAEKEQKEKEKK